MNKKKTKLMATALTATMTAGMATQLVQAAEVTPYEAALEAVITMEKDPSGANIDKAYNAVKALEAGAQKDTLYKRVEAVAAPHHKAVYDIMVTAREKKDLKTIGEARKAVAGMAKIFIKDAYTWSSELDTFTIEYQKTVVDTLNAIVDGKKEVKQATINELREIIVGLELQRSNEGLLKLVLDYSATLDKVQMDYVDAVLAEVKAATTEAELTVAKAKYNDLLTMKDEALKAAVQSNIGAAIVAKEAEVSTPKVLGINSLNASQLEVKFNKDVDVATAETIANYTLAKSDGTKINVTGAEVQEDGKTVVLRVDAITSKTTFTATVANVKLNGSLINEFKLYSQVMTVEDTTNATITDVIAKTNSDIATSATIYFSEPVIGGALKIDGNTVAYVLAADGLSATISTDLDASKTHSIEAINLTDSANNINTSTTKTFNVIKDVTAPTFTVSTESDSTIVLSFDKAVDKNTITTSGIILKDEALDTVAGYSVSVPVGYGNKRVEITLPGGVYAQKATRNFTILTSDAIKDSLGNKLVATQRTVSITKDEVAPTLTGIDYVKNSDGKVQYVLFKYSEKVTETANRGLTARNYTTGATVDLFGTLEDANVEVLSDGKTVKVEVKGLDVVKSGKLEVEVPAGFVNDRALVANASKVKKQVVDFGSASATPLKVTKVESAGRNQFKVTFDGAVTYSSATNPANYSINGVALPSNATVVFDDSNKNNVTVTLPTNFVSADDTAAVLRVVNVETVSGVKVSPNTNVVTVDDNTQPLIVKSKSSINANGTLSIGFSEAVNAATATSLNDLILTVNGSNITVGGGNVTIADGTGSDAGKYVLTFTTDVELKAGEKKYYEYFDINGNDTLDATDIIVRTHTAELTAGVFNLNTLSSLKVSTVSTPSVIKDMNDTVNTIAGDQSVVIK